MAKSRKRGASSNIALDASKQKQFNQTVQRIQKDEVTVGQSVPGVVYVSHLPWGFEEKPLREYFRQFGTIKQLRLSRSKKTGNPRGFAYIQFGHDDVAKIVAETMNNYLMFGKLIKCKHLLNPHPKTFRNCKRPFIKPEEICGAIVKHNKQKTADAVEKSQKKMIGKLAKLEAKLAAQGIEYKLEDPHLVEVKEHLKVKAEERKIKKTEEDKKKMEEKEEREKNAAKKPTDEDESDDDEEESDDDEEENDDDDEEESDDDKNDDAEEECKEVLKTPANKQKGQNTTNNENLENKLISSSPKESKSTKKTGNRQSLIPKEADTPQGKKNVVTEDNSDDEISFKTPPSSVKSSKLDTSTKSLKGIPVTDEKRSPKRKLNETTLKARGAATPEPLGTGKKLKLTPGPAEKKENEKISSIKKDVNTPKSSGRTLRATTCKKTLLSATKKKQLKK